MVDRGIIAFVLAALIVAGLSYYPEISAQSGAKVEIVPASQSAKVSDIVNVNVNVKDVSNLYGYQFSLAYDSTLLDYMETTEGPFLSRGFTEGTYFSIVFVDELNGVINYVLSTKTAANGVSGSGTLATVKFVAIETGTARVDLTKVLLSDEASANIPATATNGTVNIITCTDNDGDGYSSNGGACGPVDCNDNNAGINPGAAEVCWNSIDDNCNGQIDEACMVYMGIEAESGVLDTTVMQVVSDASASGGVYIQPKAGTRQSNKPKAEATYTINLPVQDDYHLWLRMYAPARKGDVLFMGFDGKFDKIASPKLGVYEWLRAEVTGGSQNYTHALKSGQHKVNIGHGEELARADKIIVTNDLLFVPSGFGEPPATDSGLTDEGSSLEMSIECSSEGWDYCTGPDACAGEIVFSVGRNSRCCSLMCPNNNIGDVNDDMIVDIFDLTLVSSRFGFMQSNPEWDAKADDCTEDRLIDVFDLVCVTNNLGTAY